MRRAAAALAVLAAVVALSTVRVGAQDAGPPPAVSATTSTTTPPGTDRFGGLYPPEAYTVRGKTDAAKPDVTFYTMAARAFYDTSRQINTLTMQATRWVWRYDLVPALTPVIQTMADVANERVVGRFGLVHFMLIILGVYVGFLFFRGRLVHGIGELAMALLCMVAAGWIAMNAVPFFTGSTTLMRQISTAMASTDSGQAGDEALTGSLQRGLIHDPWEWLSFGHVVDGTKCAPAVETALAPKASGGGGIVDKAKDAAGKVVDTALTGVVGPGVGAVEDAAAAAGNLTFKSGVDGDVSKKLDDLDCPVEKAAYENPSGTKVFGAFLTLLASVVVAALALTVDLAVIVAQAVFALLAATAMFAVVAAISPGKLRNLWWAWLAAGAKAFVAAVAGSYLLVLVLGFIGGILTVGDTADAVPMELRMLMIVAIPIVAFAFRKRIVSGAARMGSHSLGQAGSLAPSANAWSLHTATASSASGVLGVMGADPNYSLRQQGKGAYYGARDFATREHGAGLRSDARAIASSQKGRLAIAAATGGAGAVAGVGGAVKGAAMRTATRVAWSRMGGPGESGVDEPGERELLELTEVAGRSRPMTAEAYGPNLSDRRFTMPPRPGDAAPRAGALPAAPSPVGQLGPGAGTRRTRPRRDAEAATHPAGYHIESPAVEQSEVVYHPDARSARTRRLTPDSASRWDQTAEQRLLRIHEGFHDQGRDRPLQLDEIDPDMNSAHRERVVALASDLWEDEATATFLAGRGVLRLGGASAEERHWLRGADFTRAEEMTKLRGYHADGRLRLKGEGPVPADEPIHAHAARVYAGRPVT